MQYASALKDYGVDNVEMLLAQSKDDLIEAGVKPGHANFIMKKLATAVWDAGE